MALARKPRAGELPHVFNGSVEHAIAHIEESIQGKVDERCLRWYAIKVFERDGKVMEALSVSNDLKTHLEQHIADCETELDDDAESIITNQRYAYISGVIGKAVVKKAAKNSLTVSGKINRVVTDRVLALPIFVAVMFLIYAVATVTGLIAKEEVVSTFGVLYPGNLTANIQGAYTALAAWSFMIFNLLCAPCFAAMGAIRREMNSAKWTWAAIGYMCGFAYAISLIVYQLGGLISGAASFSVFTVAAVILLAGLLYLLFRPAAEQSDTVSVRSTAIGRV